MKNFILKYLDFKFYNVTWIAVVTAISIIPCLLYMPQRWGYENGLLENIQMCVLFLTLILCIKPKFNKAFFNFMSLVVIILMIREVNCFRTIFFPIPNTYHQYYSWRDLDCKWLGKLAHSLYGTYIAIVALLFFKKKIHIYLIEIIKKIKFPFWNILLAIFAMSMGAIAEKATNNNFIFEEGFELLFYVSIAGMVWLYTRNKNFNVN